MSDLRLQSPAVARNRQPILEVLEQALPKPAYVLELASGSGEHAVYFASAMPGWRWLASDPTPQALASIAAWREQARLSNLLEPVELDVMGVWPDVRVDAVVAINLVHISPWFVTKTLMMRAQERLVDGGVLYLYGPYQREGRHTSPSNEAFDADLKARDARWGIRHLESVVAEAEQQGLKLERVAEMPANNLSIVFKKQAIPEVSASPGQETVHDG